jgi:hypothetical protein
MMQKTAVSSALGALHRLDRRQRRDDELQQLSAGRAGGRAVRGPEALPRPEECR